MSEPSKCRSCGAAIVWATTSTGKQAPFDAKPIATTDLKPIGDGTYLASNTMRGYVSHFATCPNAAQHRRTRP
jgi:hypothetical protein